MKGYVYILASKKNGTLYTGVTTNPSRRWFEHQHELNLIEAVNPDWQDISHWLLDILSNAHRRYGPPGQARWSTVKPMI